MLPMCCSLAEPEPVREPNAADTQHAIIRRRVVRVSMPTCSSCPHHELPATRHEMLFGPCFILSILLAQI